MKEGIGSPYKKYYGFGKKIKGIFWYLRLICSLQPTPLNLKMLIYHLQFQVIGNVLPDTQEFTDQHFNFYNGNFSLLY